MDSQKIEIIFVICDDDPDWRMNHMRAIQEAIDADDGLKAVIDPVFKQFESGEDALDYFVNCQNTMPTREDWKKITFLITDHAMGYNKMTGAGLVLALDSHGVFPQYGSIRTSSLFSSIMGIFDEAGRRDLLEKVPLFEKPDNLIFGRFISEALGGIIRQTKKIGAVPEPFGMQSEGPC
jgi:hypothetical protein